MKKATCNGRGGPSPALSNVAGRPPVRRADTQVGPHTRRAIQKRPLWTKMVGAFGYRFHARGGWAVAQAQQGKTYRIGVLAQPGKAEERLEIKGFRAGLAEAGYVEGKNFQLNIPNVKTYDELRPIAKGYVEGKVDVIVTNSGTATEIANRTTKRIFIVFIWGVTDPVESGLVKSLARPDTNITGLTNEAGAEIYGSVWSFLRRWFRA